ncbi:hypothetical protein [Bacteroides faecis]|uniref:hypothetical protein n=1 Tax=Bacteroides faecis TaxID=674529 RepID=UPI00338DB983
MTSVHRKTNFEQWEYRTGESLSHEIIHMIPKYANNFNKELSAADITLYGKIHFNHNRSDNELNMHCHLIVSCFNHIGIKCVNTKRNSLSKRSGFHFINDENFIINATNLIFYFSME